MNDRFKFRAWNIIVNQYEYFDFHSLAKMDYDKIQWHILKFEQCTSLKDKNGKLIYEGDIVRVNGDVMTIPIEYENEKAFVNWDEDGFFLHFESGEIERLFQECWEYEVVGNIHENTELLEDK